MMKQGKAFKDGGKFSRVFSVRMRWYIWRLKSKNSDVRKAAAVALGEIGSKEAVPHLIKALKDKKWYVRKAAAEALGKIGSKEAVPHLAKALKDEDRDVRRAAVQALKEIEWQPQSQEEKILYLVAKKSLE